MAISYSENATLTCPSCGQQFAAEVWMLVDAEEQPELAHALREGTLNVVTCPHCGHRGPAGAPLLFHDPANRRVYFAAPPGAAEHELREQVQSLLYLLIGSLPMEARHPYLGDVQVEQDVAGVRRAVLRQQGARRRPRGEGPVEALRASPGPAAPARSAGDHVGAARPPDVPSADSSPVLTAIQALIAANNAAEFEAVVDEHPVLLTAAADATIAQLSAVAFDQGQRAVAEALQEARTLLAELRASREDTHKTTEPGAREAAAPAPPPSPSPVPQLSAAAYQALLRVSSPDELLEAVRDHPTLLEPWADADLATRVEAALDAGNERLARGIEERREILAELRAEFTGQAPLLQAVQALLQADEEDELAQVLMEYPILLTDAAQDALFKLAAGARAQGDEQLAHYAIECRAMLRKVREGLEDDLSAA